MLSKDDRPGKRLFDQRRAMSDYDLIIIGGGEAGISAVLRSAQLGARVCLVNREPELGGGCIGRGLSPARPRAMPPNSWKI